jgi:hypothetical protein
MYLPDRTRGITEAPVERRSNMSTTHGSRRIVASALMSLSVAMAGLGLAHGTAEALPGIPLPQGSWPGCPEDHPEGPCHWCPGDPPVQTGNIRVYPVIWDERVCHTYWYVYSGQGNVAHNIFEGEVPPAPPPPPPNLTPPLPPGWCWSLFIPTTSCPNG